MPFFTITSITRIAVPSTHGTYSYEDDTAALFRRP